MVLSAIGDLIRIEFNDGSASIRIDVDVVICLFFERESLLQFGFSGLLV